MSCLCKLTVLRMQRSRWSFPSLHVFVGVWDFYSATPSQTALCSPHMLALKQRKVVWSGLSTRFERRTDDFAC